ncbi:MAG: SAM-dependent methyltransferase [Deltaproteobacteria bacterium]|nr:SAM-dependent methyltransferase [Deltaproteobacteria bacterium]
MAQGELTLKQSYQFISGSLKSGNEITPIAAGKLKGGHILFNAGGVLFVGEVNGNTMQGTVSTGGRWSAARVK